MSETDNDWVDRLVAKLVEDELKIMNFPKIFIDKFGRIMKPEAGQQFEADAVTNQSLFKEWISLAYFASKVKLCRCGGREWRCEIPELKLAVQLRKYTGKGRATHWCVTYCGSFECSQSSDSVENSSNDIMMTEAHSTERKRKRETVVRNFSTFESVGEY